MGDVVMLLRGQTPVNLSIEELMAAAPPRWHGAGKVQYIRPPTAFLPPPLVHDMCCQTYMDNKESMHTGLLQVLGCVLL